MEKDTEIIDEESRISDDMSADVVDEAPTVADPDDTADVDEGKALMDAVDKLADEDDDEGVELSFKTIIGGDILRSRIVLKQVYFIIFCVVLMVLHTWNRYSGQDDSIHIDNLRKDLQDWKYNVLTQSSELMNYTRQSNVEQAIKETPDSSLTVAVTAPYLLTSGSSLEGGVEIEEEEGKEDANE